MTIKERFTVSGGELVDKVKQLFSDDLGRVTAEEAEVLRLTRKNGIEAFIELKFSLGIIPELSINYIISLLNGFGCFVVNIPQNSPVL